mmetsp:Transcript_35798/g.84145  ORF Transcript_35798/g.84145 Transcript_35798/m.84145 type:complete len:480 (-) Transcript_35798:734-2173(-)
MLRLESFRRRKACHNLQAIDLELDFVVVGRLGLERAVHLRSDQRRVFAVPVQADGKVVRSAVVVQELVHFDIVDEDVGVWDRECPCAIRTLGEHAEAHAIAAHSHACNLPELLSSVLELARDLHDRRVPSHVPFLHHALCRADDQVSSVDVDVRRAPVRLAERHCSNDAARQVRDLNSTFAGHVEVDRLVLFGLGPDGDADGVGFEARDRLEPPGERVDLEDLCLAPAPDHNVARRRVAARDRNRRRHLHHVPWLLLVPEIGPLLVLVDDRDALVVADTVRVQHAQLVVVHLHQRHPIPHLALELVLDEDVAGVVGGGREHPRHVRPLQVHDCGVQLDRRVQQRLPVLCGAVGILRVALEPEEHVAFRRACGEDAAVLAVGDGLDLVVGGHGVVLDAQDEVLLLGDLPEAEHPLRRRRQQQPRVHPERQHPVRVVIERAGRELRAVQDLALAGVVGAGDDHHEEVVVDPDDLVLLVVVL